MFEKQLKKWGCIISEQLHPALTDEIKTLKLTIFTLRIYSNLLSNSRVTALIVLLSRYRYET